MAGSADQDPHSSLDASTIDCKHGVVVAMSESALSRLARFVIDDPLDADTRTRDVVRDGLIDALGCVHAGVRTSVAIRSRRAVLDMGAGGPARVIGTKMCVPAQSTRLKAK